MKNLKIKIQMTKMMLFVVTVCMIPTFATMYILDKSFFLKNFVAMAAIVYAMLTPIIFAFAHLLLDKVNIKKDKDI